MAAEIFAYCERGRDATFWAEPVNAWTNAAFILAALVAAWRLGRTPWRNHTADAYLLIALLVAIGVGSFLFHTYATRWAAAADVGPILAFIAVYLMFALVRFVGMAPGVALVLVSGFMSIAYQARYLRCAPDLAMRYDGGAGTCLNGSIAYMPAFGALLLVAVWLGIRRHPAATALLSAAAILAVSLTLRTLDPTLCKAAVIAGYRLGTHFAWHALNGLLLGILVIAAIDHWRYTADRRHGASAP